MGMMRMLFLLMLIKEFSSVKFSPESSKSSEVSKRISQNSTVAKSKITVETKSGIKKTTKIETKSDAKQKQTATDIPNTLHSFDLSTVHKLTMSSVLYNPTNHVSAWVDKIFGSKAIFYPRSGVDGTLEVKELSDYEIHERSENFRVKFSMPYYAEWPSCSVELLGFVQQNELGPFNSLIREDLYIGNAKLVVKKRGIDWKCFYRVLFENWREDMKYSEPNYWAVLFYCPSPTLQACNAVENLLRNDTKPENSMKKTMREDGVIVMQTPGNSSIRAEWRAKFTSVPFKSKYEQYESNFTDGPSYGNSPADADNSPMTWNVKAKSLQLAVCLSIPYTSTDIEKTIGNGAMLLEWVRYYALLGFKVLIYDRDGKNKHHIFKSKYGTAQRVRVPPGRLVYHPYTIRGLLDPSRKGLTYDNTDNTTSSDKNEMDYKRGRYESQGHDKVQTLTHCRFEARALYGIDNVLVVDFDEFLYCPVASATLKGQSGWINQYFSHMKSVGIDQIEFTQRVLGNKTVSPRDCVVEKAVSGKSIFDCFSSYNYYNGAHSIKSMHLGHSCPLTGYHNSCPTDEIPRSHDCLCTSLLVKSNNWRPYEHRKGRECAVIHLSTNNNSYGRPEYVFTDEEQKELVASKLELWSIVNSRRSKKPTQNNNSTN